MIRKMTSRRSYLVRAMYDWIIDNQMTPYVLIDAQVDYVEVPEDYVIDGQILMNISPSAIQGLGINPRALTFRASFDGVVTDIYAPIASIMAVYARETGKGFFFGEEEDGEAVDAPEPWMPHSEEPRVGPVSRDHLTVIK